MGHSETTHQVAPTFLSHLSHPISSSVPGTGTQLRLHLGLSHSWVGLKGMDGAVAPPSPPAGRQVGVERKAQERAKGLIGPGLFSLASQLQGLCKGNFCPLVSEDSACPVLGTLLVSALRGNAPPPFRGVLYRDGIQRGRGPDRKGGMAYPRQVLP